jgi:hypothetical protein
MPASKKTPARGKNPYQSRVIKNVLGLSDETVSYSKAKREWAYRGEVMDHGPLKDQIPKPAECQFCGHPIRYGYRLHNVVTARTVEVGSECLGNFIVITPSLAKSLDADKRAAKTQYQNRLLKRRREIYQAAVREVTKIEDAVLAEVRKQGGGGFVPQRLPTSLQHDREALSMIGRNPGYFYTRITGPRGGLNPDVIPALAKKYGVTVDLEKITAFIAEAEPLKPLDRISAF